MPRPVVIRIALRLPHPRDAAYEWLTDFQDDDARRASGAVLRSRRVTLREKTRAVYEGTTEILGRASRAVTDVTLLPPDRWEARVVEGPRTGSWTDYSLVPDGADACRLTVTYHFVFADPKTQVAARMLQPLVRRSLARMWAGFASDMAREL